MRNYTFGINVLSADELAGIAPQVKAFMDEVGEGTAEIQVAINPHGIGLDDEGELTPAIGFAYAPLDYAEEDEEYDEE